MLSDEFVAHCLLSLLRVKDELMKLVRSYSSGIGALTLKIERLVDNEFGQVHKVTCNACREPEPFDRRI